MRTWAWGRSFHDHQAVLRGSRSIQIGGLAQQKGHRVLLPHRLANSTPILLCHHCASSAFCGPDRPGCPGAAPHSRSTGAGCPPDRPGSGASVGSGYSRSRATVFITKPGLQKPHCSALVGNEGNKVARLLLKALQGLDAAAVHPGGQQAAGQHRSPVQQDGARTAVGGLAPPLDTEGSRGPEESPAAGCRPGPRRPGAFRSNSDGSPYQRTSLQLQQAPAHQDLADLRSVLRPGTQVVSHGDPAGQILRHGLGAVPGDSAGQQPLLIPVDPGPSRRAPMEKRNAPSRRAMAQVRTGKSVALLR